MFVVTRIYGSGSSPECHRTTLLVQHCLFSDGCNRSIERHNVAACRNPKRQMGIGKVLEIGNAQHGFVRYLYFRTVPGIVHYERTLCLLLLYDRAYFGICKARRGTNAGISVPHNFLYQIVWIGRHDGFSCFIDVFHVEIVVPIVAHKHNNVLPIASILIGCIVDGFVYHSLCIGYCSYWKTSNTYIFLVNIGLINALSLIHKRVPPIVYIAIGQAERVVAFVSEQVIVSI